MLGAMLAVAIYSRKGSIPEPFHSLARVQECTQNLTELSAALTRYHNKNGSYPARLEDLYPDFLQNSRVLWCPAAVRDRSAGSSYRYRRPASDAAPKFVAVGCYDHTMRTGRVVLEVRLDGSVANRHEDLAEAMNEARPVQGQEKKGAK